MNTIKHVKKYIFVIALIGILAVTLGCPTESTTQPTSVTGITVTGEAGATDVPKNETLQMSAAIQPVDATEQSVTWSVIDGITGAATISETGLLTATSEGTVTVIATANDGSAIVGELEVNVTAPNTVVSISAISGVTAPVQGETPVSTVTATAEYTGTVAWEPSHSPYEPGTVYTATITLEAKSGYTFTGVTTDSFTVGVATATNAEDSGVVTAIFPATETIMVNSTAIPGVTAPATGVTPDLAITATEQYTGAITWTPTDSPYAASTVYTATITLEAKSGYTFIGVAADSFTVAGATTVTNPADSGVVTAVFPATGATPAVAVSTTAIPGVTAPVRGATSVSTITDTTEYTGTVAWEPSHSTYEPGTVYTATITLTAKTDFTFEGVAADSFTVADATTVTNPADSGVVTAVFPATAEAPLATVDLGTAANYVILAETTVTTTGTTAITGDLGLSPAATSAYTGFNETLDSTNTFATSDLVNGNLYAASMTSPTPSILTTAVGDMTTAYNDAASRSNPDELNYFDGLIGGKTLAPGLYKWDTAVTISDDLTLNGTADDVWIFQISGTLDLAGGFKVLLTGGALAENVFWQVADGVTLKASSHMEGIILGKTQIIFMTGSSIKGRALAQTQVTLDAATIVGPQAL